MAERDYWSATDRVASKNTQQGMPTPEKKVPGQVRVEKQKETLKMPAEKKLMTPAEISQSMEAAKKERKEKEMISTYNELFNQRAKTIENWAATSRDAKTIRENLSVDEKKFMSSFIDAELASNSALMAEVVKEGLESDRHRTASAAEVGLAKIKDRIFHKDNEFSKRGLSLFNRRKETSPDQKKQSELDENAAKTAIDALSTTVGRGIHDALEFERHLRAYNTKKKKESNPEIRPPAAILQRKDMKKAPIPRVESNDPDDEPKDEPGFFGAIKGYFRGE